jgi:hypothetical protein
MEKSLKHILDVYRQVRKFGSTRIDAVKIVAKKNRVSQQTISSACTRDIGIRGVAELDYLLEPETMGEFRTKLIQRFPNSHDEIDRFLGSFVQTGQNQKHDLSKRMDTLFDDERKNLLNQLMILFFKDKFLEWVSRPDIPTDVRDQVNEWLNMI